MKLPPYGRDVANNPSNVFIYAGAGAWAVGRARAKIVGNNSVMVLPPDEDFYKYRWPVQGVPLMLIWHNGSLSEVKAFGEHLIRCGSPSVVAPHSEDPEGCLFIKPIQRAAA
jgi:hypothetical protein